MKIRADHIAHALQNKHAEDAFFTQVKNGPTHTSTNLLIMDAVAIKRSWSKPCITGYEIKVNRSDFTRDEKWVYYRQYCHRMYLACPTGLIAPEELPDDTGLIWYNPEKKSLYTKKKALFRDIELPVEMLYYLVICRHDPERHPYFSSRREALEAWVDEKINTRTLSERVSTCLIHRLKEAEGKISKMEFEIKSLQRDSERYQELSGIMREFGISIWNPVESLKKTLESRLPPEAVRLITDISQKAVSLRSLVEKTV